MKIPEQGELLDGKYLIEAPIGEGGFAVVMRGTTVGTERPVAIKFLRPTAAGYEGSRAARFQREMRVIAQLQCPHTLTLFDHGRTADGVLYMVCEYVEGEDLSLLLQRRGRLHEKEAIWVLYQALMSLAEAHQLGMLHRDLKPDNIRVFEYGNDPLRVKLIDFGIAHSLDSTNVRLTGTGNIVGTPRYMAPEQMLGEELTPATDIYGLGLVACEMLAGREITMFTGGTRHVELGRELGVSEPLRRVVHRMVAFDVAQRYQDAGAAMADLRVLMPGSSSGSVPVAPEEPRRAAPATIEEPTPGRSAVHLGLGAGALVVVGLGALMIAGGGDEVAAAKPTERIVSITRPSEAPPSTSTPSAQPRVEPEVEAASAPDAAGNPATGCGKAPPFLGEGILRQVTGLDDENRMLYIPKSYDPHRQHAVILLLREAGQSRAHLFDVGFGELADRENLVLIAPGGGDASIDISNVQGKLWNKPGDIEDIKSIWSFVTSELCLDPTRVYAVGDVSGGLAVERIPCEWPVTAMASNGFNAQRDLPACDHRRAVPYLQLLFTEDQYNPTDGGPNATGVDKMSWDEAAKRWRKLNGCTEEKRVMKAPHGTCTQFACDAAFSQCRIEGGRPWPGTEPPVWEQFNGTRGGRASEFESVETIWKFFAAAPPLDPPGVE